MFVCLRFPHFAAWAMAQIDTALASKAFAICERDKVIAPSLMALQKGIKTGMSVGKASARLDGLLILPRDKSCEALAWQEVQQALYGLTPKIEESKPGLLFCEAAPEKLARLLYQWNHIPAAKKLTGAGNDRDVPICFGVSAGSASDRATSHLAALHAPGGTCRQVKGGRDWSFAGAIPLSNLGEVVSPEAIERLLWFGWTTIGALRPLSRRQLEEQFDGKGLGSDGLTLYQFAQGAKCRDNLRPVSTWQPPTQVSARVAFALPATQPCEWNEGLCDILLHACLDLGTRCAGTLEITAQTPIAPLTSRRVLREPSNNPKTLLLPLQSALEEALRVLAPLPVVVQGLELRLANLLVPNAQPELWDDPQATRQQKLHGVVRLVEDRLPGKLGCLTAVQPHSPFEEEVWGWNSALEKLNQKKLASQPYSYPQACSKQSSRRREVTRPASPTR